MDNSNGTAIIVAGLIIAMAILATGMNPGDNIAFVDNSTAMPVVNDINTSLDSIIVDDNKNRVRAGLHGELEVGTKSSDISVLFQYNVAPDDVEVELIGDAQIFHNISQMSLRVGIGEAHVESLDAVRYRPGHGAYGIFTSGWDFGGERNTEAYIGLTNGEEDGFFIGFDNREFGVGRYVEGKKIFINQSDWNGTVESSGCVINTTRLSYYRISYGFFELGPVEYEHYCGKSIGWVTMHTLEPELANQSSTLVTSPALPIHMHITRELPTGGIITMRTTSWNAGIINGNNDIVGNRYFTVASNKTLVQDEKISIFTIRSNGTFFNRKNQVQAVLQFFSATNEGNRPVQVELAKNCFIDNNTEIYTTVNANNSMMLFDINSTLNQTQSEIDCEDQLIFQIPANGNVVQDLTTQDIRMRRNDTLMVTSTSRNNQVNIVSASVRWKEEY